MTREKAARGIRRTPANKVMVKVENESKLIVVLLLTMNCNQHEVAEQARRRILFQKSIALAVQHIKREQRQ
jgi:hypothetical protein